MSSIGFIGAGKMAFSLARGFIRSGVIKANQIIASCPQTDEPLLKHFKDLGCQTTYDNSDVIQNSNIVILAIKPQVLPNILGDVSKLFTANHLVVSLAMGVRIKDIEKMLPERTRVIRTMPNTPVEVREGVSVCSMGTNATKSDSESIIKLMQSVGICEEVPETYLDAITGLSGSGPAYMYVAIEALADGGVNQGLPRALALKLATQTMLGASKMVQESKRHPGELKDEVCSPGGTTIAGVSSLEQDGFRSSLIKAIGAAAGRAREQSELKSN